MRFSYFKEYVLLLKRKGSKVDIPTFIDMVDSLSPNIKLVNASSQTMFGTT